MAETVISHKKLERLAELRDDAGIVSLYLNVDPKLMYDRVHPAAAFKGALKRFLRRTRSERWLEAVHREKDRILRELSDWQPRGRGLVIFACEPAGIWEVLSLEVAVPTLMTVDTTTQTAVLAQILDEYPRFVVAVVQKDRALVYTAEQGTAEEMHAIRSNVPGRHDQGGWSQARFQRHIESKVSGHLKKVTEELEKLYYEQPYNRLAIGGGEEAVIELRKMLPEPVSRRVIGTFPVDLKHESEEAILEKARRLRDEDERRSETETVGRVIDAAKSGGQGAVGVERTLEAIRQERVRTLLVADGLELEGVACVACDHFDIQAIETCPICGGATESTVDVLDRAVEKAYLSGATVDTVFGEARDTLMEDGGVGALLRY
jgi:peptide chain release factor subunit 1